MSLLALATFLLLRMNLFSSAPLTDAQLKSLWAFLGVALGSVATLIGTLLTDQNNRRKATLDSLALEQQKQQGKEAERRLTLDARTKALELVSQNGDYAPKAQVGGAVATMMELRGGPAAIRILADLWERDCIGLATAVWLIDEILADEAARAADKIQASELLARNAAKLIPLEDDPDQDWDRWPDAAQDRWPGELPSMAKNNFILLAVRTLLARKPSWWKGRELFPATTLWFGQDDEEYGTLIAATLVRLLDLGFPMAEEDRIRASAEGVNFAPWFAHLLDQLPGWAAGEEPEAVPEASAKRDIIAVGGSSTVPVSIPEALDGGAKVPAPGTPVATPGEPDGGAEEPPPVTTAATPGQPDGGAKVPAPGTPVATPGEPDGGAEEPPPVTTAATPGQPDGGAKVPAPRTPGEPDRGAEEPPPVTTAATPGEPEPTRGAL
ncbi:hypothetical protein PHK61_31135 [Actinomycetospora lutea]|uniref:hypothetical protein n=1 Tax=Actinomycetospora lutea TaxID=663604 RepID=UPI0023650ECD|nr:hypothetical protein [Actinomycetospora lutea]MDD7942876.1 hypothetical protein [Actinomycetospora lutea]